MKEFFRTIIGIAVIAGLMCAHVRLSRIVYDNRNHYEQLLTYPPFIELDPNVISILTFGHRGVYEDFINLWALQVLASDEIKKYKPDVVSRYITKFIKQRPKLESLYMFSCFVIGFDLKGPQYCKDINIVGMQVFPDSWRIPMTQGFIHAFEMYEPAQAAAYFHMAATRPDSPPYVTSLARRLIDNRVLTPDDLEKSVDLIKSIPGGERYKDFIEQAQRREKEVKEENIPWLTPEGPEPIPETVTP